MAAGVSLLAPMLLAFSSYALKLFAMIMKRGLIGSFHKVSIKHLQCYLNEFGYRFNLPTYASRP